MLDGELPAWATPDEAASWLSARTGKQWSLPLLLARGLRPSVWLDFHPDLPLVLFKGRHEGFRAEFVFASDTGRMAFDRTALLTMTRLPDGTLARFAPGLEFKTEDLRFARDDLRALLEQLSHDDARARAARQGPRVQQAHGRGH